MEQGTPETIRRYFCSGNNKQGQSREALTYKKISGYLQMKMLGKTFPDINAGTAIANLPNHPDPIEQHG
ncbi:MULTISPECIES: hypothetical protein [Pseudomonas]|uniref:Uncharacterized protein n=1 Tax=Pseudomonas frederiksbergensis TaxID=104087 RepID=A0A2S8H6A2_9PSED|nr:MULTISPECIES: hypothetical protein [Pseudomonas]PQO98022.1 hypothetical protein C5612_28550 [Pseudomonas frederiksbergensis]WLG52231.1 hypothetical protein PSH64_06845 [Pseudomonas sp. FP1742]